MRGIPGRAQHASARRYRYMLCRWPSSPSLQAPPTSPPCRRRRAPHLRRGPDCAVIRPHGGDRHCRNVGAASHLAIGGRAPERLLGALDGVLRQHAPRSRRGRGCRRCGLSRNPAHPTAALCRADGLSEGLPRYALRTRSRRLPTFSFCLRCSAWVFTVLLLTPRQLAISRSVQPRRISASTSSSLGVSISSDTD